MALQQPRAAKCLAAHTTLVLEVMRKYVHGQCWHGHIHLAARWALARHLAIQAAMRLLVAAQVRRCGVCFAALIACVSRARLFCFHTTFACLLGLTSPA